MLFCHRDGVPGGAWPAPLRPTRVPQAGAHDAQLAWLAQQARAVENCVGSRGAPFRSAALLESQFQCAHLLEGSAAVYAPFGEVSARAIPLLEWLARAPLHWACGLLTCLAGPGPCP